MAQSAVLKLRKYTVKLENMSSIRSDNGFAWIIAQPLLEPLLNMHAASYMSVITYLNINVMTWSYLILRAIPAIHEINALREVF